MRTFKDIEQVKQDLRNEKPLLELISDTSGQKPLKVSKDLYKMNCVFHKENTPSMMITPSRGLYYCFGCHAGGDEFEYLERLFNLSFIESIHRYSELASMDLSPYYKELSPEEHEKERLVALLDSFLMTSSHALYNGNGVNNALPYLQKRGFSDEIIKQFRIGYSATPVANPDATMKSLELDRLDIFYDSLVFPDFDAYGRPVRVYGRPFKKKNEKDPKYIGTSQRTPLHEYTLYGFHIARKNARKHGGKVIAVEGQADTAKMHQHGFDNTCGLKGTVFNDDTIKLLSQFKVQEVILLLDGDEAGRNATRAIVSKYYAASERPDLRIRVANIFGYDPDEFLNAFGRERMQEVINKAVYAIEYIIDDVFSSRPYTTTTERIDLLRELQPYVNNADQIEKKLAIHEIATRLQMDVVFVEDFFKINNTVVKYQLYSIDGERTVLAHCIRNTNFLIGIMDTLSPDDFYLSKHRALYQLLCSMVDNKEVLINIETVIGQANNSGIAAYFENGEYIKGLAGVPSGAIDFHINDIKDKSVRRKVDSYTDQLKGSLNDLHVDATQAIEVFNNHVTNVVVTKSDDKVMDAGKQVDLAMGIVMDRMHNPNTMTGYDIGDRLKALSLQLRGLNRKRIHTIAANQGVGKSKLLANMLMGTTVEQINKVPALWFSYEMAEEENTLRNLAILSGISQDAIMDGTLTHDEHDILQQWALVLRQSPLFMTTKGRSIEEALALARKHILYNGVKIIAFDYIQLMTADTKFGAKKNEMFGIITKKLKEFVQDMDVAAVVVAQLGKQGVNKEIATAEDVYFGYEIAQDSDVFAVIQRKSQEQIDQMGLQKGNLLINLDKNRGRKDDQLYNVYAHDTNARITIV